MSAVQELHNASQPANPLLPGPFTHPLPPPSAPANPVHGSSASACLTRKPRTRSSHGNHAPAAPRGNHAPAAPHGNHAPAAPQPRPHISSTRISSIIPHLPCPHISSITPRPSCPHISSIIPHLPCPHISSYLPARPARISAAPLPACPARRLVVTSSPVAPTS